MSTVLHAMSVRKQLTLAFGFLVCVIAALAVLAGELLFVSQQNFRAYIEGIDARAKVAEQVREAVDNRAVAVRNMVLMRPNDDLQGQYRVAVQAHKTVQEQMARLQTMARTSSDATPTTIAFIEKIADVEHRYGPVALSIADLAQRRMTTEATQKILDECQPLLTELIAAVDAYHRYTAQRAEQKIADARSGYLFDRNLLIGVAITALAIAIVCGRTIVRSLGGILGAEPAALKQVAQAVAAGDLSPVNLGQGVPTTSVLALLAHMQRSLHTTVAQVRDAADSIMTGASQIAAGNDDLSRRTEEQASALQQTAATMDEIASTIQNNATNAERAARMAGNSLEVVQQSNALVQRVVASMSDINAGSRRIADIVSVIDSIAFQTNILALNAAVEAARAGEQGKGFAVVASEVRSLANRSAGAATEIKQLIGASVTAVADGVALAEQAGTSMSTVAGSVTSLADVVQEISSASREQSLGVSQVGDAVNQMDRVTQQNAALVEEAAAAAGSLRIQAQHLVEAVQVFLLEGRRTTLDGIQASPAPLALS